MANTQLTQTGAQVQADLNRIEALPTPTNADSGKYLGVDSNGNFALISGTPSGYTVNVTNGLSVDHDVVLYDGQDNTGTYLGLLSVNTSDSYTITSGYIYVEWDNPLTTGDVTFSESGVIVGNPATITGNTTLSMAIAEPSLANTTWFMNSIVSGQSVASTTFSISFTSNNENFTTLVFDSWSAPFSSSIYYDSLRVFNKIEWESYYYMTISITGGTDVTNATLRAWLEENATQIS